MKQIIINNEEMQIRVAVVQDGKLQDFFIERTNRDQLVGSIYKGRIKNLEPSLQAAFVDIGCGKNAFLHYWDMLPATQDMFEEEQDDDETPQALTAPATNGKAQSTPPQANPEVMPKSKKGFLAKILGFLSASRQQPAPTPQGKNASAVALSVPAKKQQANKKKHGKAAEKQQPTVEDIPNLFKVDQEILVQVTKGPIGTKGARITTNLSIPGRFLVLLPNSPHIGVSRKVEDKAERKRLRQLVDKLELPGNNMGLICRTVGEGCTTEYFQRDLDLLVENWQKSEKKASSKHAPVCVYQEPDLAERTLRDCLTEDVDEIITDSQETYNRAQELCKRYSLQNTLKIRLYQNPTPIFQKHNLNQQIDTIYNRKVNLRDDEGNDCGYICIDETEALIAIDVNTGKNKTGKDQPETILKTNLCAVEEIARQLRLRNVGGLVVLDLIDMADKQDQQKVYKHLKERLALDRARTRIYPISPLGLLEMTRQRENESLESATFDNCPYCKGRGLVKSATSMSVEIQRKLNEVLAKRKRNNQLKPNHPFTITANPSVIERLKNVDNKVFQGISSDYSVSLHYTADKFCHVEEYSLNDNVSGQEL